MYGLRHGRNLRSYTVTFLGGPRARTQATVTSLVSGEAPDVLLTPGRPDWLYVLAGAARADGSLPYLWMPKSKSVKVISEAAMVLREEFGSR